MKHRAFIILLVLLLCVTIVSCRSQADADSENAAGEKQSESTNGSTSSPADKPEEGLSEEEDSTGAEISEESPKESQQGSEQPDSTEAGSVDTEIPPSDDLSDAEYSFKIGSMSLTLRESGIDEKIAELPLTLISETTEELGEGNDTFTGSFLKKVKYEGLELTQFAPNDNPEHFWVMQMTASAPGIYTYRGVQVGDTQGTMHELYPEAELIPDTETYRYAVGEFEELTFTISDDAISQITLTYYMP